MGVGESGRVSVGESEWGVRVVDRGESESGG